MSKSWEEVSDAAMRPSGVFQRPVKNGSDSALGRAFFDLIFLGLLVVSPATLASEWIYSVQTGDNLWNLTEQHLTSIALVSKLQSLNQISDPFHIPPGTKLRIPLQWLRVGPVTARVVQMFGAASANLQAGRVAQAVAVGTQFATGDELRTDAGGDVTIEFADGSTLYVRSGSRLVFARLQGYGTTGMVDTRVRVIEGRVESRVKPAVGAGSRFEISSPSAVTAVRGTDYRVGAATDATRAEVLGGRVGVTSEGQTVQVSGGFGTLAEMGRPPLEPIKLLPPPMLDSLPQVFERVPIRFEISALVGAHAYRLQIAANEEFHATRYDARHESADAIGPDLPDGRYMLRVRGIDAQGLEGENADHEFSVNARPEPPSMIQPTFGARVVETRPVFKWTALERAHAYHFQLGRAATFTPALVDIPEHAQSEFTVAGELAPGKYFWRVAMLDAKDGEGPYSDVQEFRLLAPGPEVTTVQTDEKNLDIRWRAGLAGQQYRYQLARDAQFESLVADQRVSAAQVRLVKPEPGRYFLRVSTIDADGEEGPFGPTQSLEVARKGTYWWMLALPLIPLLL